ncbi:hypothetical protein M3P21_10840 [Ruegeria sp. 2012CJ41-6]|uniref:Lipoprotein n=1 Tax=Ruegeria spongiae TaxID=2942209 RepID=A0ABT0Q3L2_9RHOB|nr:hypothetical protein [Ruegeria spongiae]MCL6284027.1 hypothetical protein [Ruegeria spongiae]
MVLNKLKHLALVGALVLSGCVSPDVVQRNNIGDTKLSCDEIHNQIAQLDAIRAEARKGQTVSGQNVAAALLFWPAVIGNYSNASEALKAADARHEVLVSLSRKRGC